MEFRQRVYGVWLAGGAARALPPTPKGLVRTPSADGSPRPARPHRGWAPPGAAARHRGAARPAGRGAAGARVRGLPVPPGAARPLHGRKGKDDRLHARVPAGRRARAARQRVPVPALRAEPSAGGRVARVVAHGRRPSGRAHSACRADTRAAMALVLAALDTAYEPAAGWFLGLLGPAPIPAEAARRRGDRSPPVETPPHPWPHRWRGGRSLAGSAKPATGPPRDPARGGGGVLRRERRVKRTGCRTPMGFRSRSRCW